MMRDKVEFNGTIKKKLSYKQEHNFPWKPEKKTHRPSLKSKPNKDSLLRVNNKYIKLNLRNGNKMKMFCLLI